MGSWDTKETTGLLDDADVYIEKCRFGYDAKYGDAPILILEGRSPEGNPEDDYQVRQFFSIGKGWEPAKGGKQAVNSEGEEEFHKSSNYAMFFEAFLGLGKEATDTIKGRGFPDDATIWEGLAVHVERQEIDRGEFGKKKILLPTAFLGEKDFPGPGGGGKAAAAKAKAAKAKAKGDDSDLRAALVTLAGEHDDHDGFLAAVYEAYPDIEDDKDLFGDLIDENGSIWTEAH